MNTQPTATTETLMEPPQVPLDQVIEGDCLEVMKRLPDGSIDLVFADPPYNLQLQQELWRPNLTRVDAVDDAWDRFGSFAEYDSFTRAWLGECRRLLKPTGTLWVIGSYHNIYRVGNVLQDLGYWILNDVTWIKCLAGDTELLALINGIPIVSSIKDLIRIDLNENRIQLPSFDDHGCFTWVNLTHWQRSEKSTGVRIDLEDGTWVECTPQHRFPVARNGEIEYFAAEALTGGDDLLRLDLQRFPLIAQLNIEGTKVGSSNNVFQGDLGTVKITRIQPSNHKTFYDLAVDGNHVFALANGLLTHNSNPMPNFRGVRFTNAHETLLWAQKERGASYTFNYNAMKALNEGLQMRSDWVLPICSGRERLKVNGEKAHPTQKPEALLYRVLLSSTKSGDVVLDPFFGTGTTGAVARRMHRHFIGIEREAFYAQIARERIAQVAQLEFDPQVFVTPTKRGQPRIPFGQLIEYGYVEPGQVLYFGGSRSVCAVVQADGSLEYNGERGSIHHLARLLRQAPANGWEHWYYQEAATGQLRPIDDLRQAFRENSTKEISDS